MKKILSPKEFSNYITRKKEENYNQYLVNKKQNKTNEENLENFIGE